MHVLLIYLRLAVAITPHFEATSPAVDHEAYQNDDDEKAANDAQHDYASADVGVHTATAGLSAIRARESRSRIPIYRGNGGHSTRPSTTPTARRHNLLNDDRFLHLQDCYPETCRERRGGVECRIVLQNPKDFQRSGRTRCHDAAFDPDTCQCDIEGDVGRLNSGKRISQIGPEGDGVEIIDSSVQNEAGRNCSDTHTSRRGRGRW